MMPDVAKLGATLRSRWFSIGLHVGLWLLLILLLKGIQFGGHALKFSEQLADSSPVNVPVPVGRLAAWATPNPARELVALPTNISFFATTYFVPRTPPAGTTPPPPPPPPPTTWKLELGYQGYYRTGDGPKYVLLQMGGKLVSIPEGHMVVTNLYIVDAAVRALTLTNSAAQTNVIALNTRQVLEVPLK